MVNSKPFKVTLKDQIDSLTLWNAYRVSKPQMKSDELPNLEEIIKMGLPVNGLKYYVLEIQSSLLFRDLILSLRDIMGAWAVSNRVAKINRDTTPLSDEAKIYLDEKMYKAVENNLELVYQRIESGEPQEYVKGSLPIMTLTTLTVGIDLRTLINFLYTIESIAPDYFSVVGNEILNECNLVDIYNIHPKRNLYDSLALLDIDRSNGSSGYMHQIYKKDVSMNLLAQVVRKNILVKSEVWNYLKNQPIQLWSKRACDSVDVAIYLTEDNIKSIQSTRTCWFAMFDKHNNESWDYLLSDIIKNKSASQFLGELPCHGCGEYCVLKGDMMARVDKIDSHFYPCPILLNDPSIVDERKEKYQSDSVIMEKWVEAKRFIPFDPDNELYRRYRK